ncbi:spheroidene monooxygenase [Quadrisphaera granulorum]|uniref:Spheroidene monooxygenase n=2 Tax=Quadrisphaera granulorum TaxID=317664 RepID=A0A316A6Y1_9ACTN|nr:spheroidene monooxygenase [Quadrisphaera granulorum]SZE96740.1 spheroidene monooxygenase [Quadrisphaera granulorum]
MSTLGKPTRASRGYRASVASERSDDGGGAVRVRAVLHLWRVPTPAVPAAIARMALDRRHLRASGAAFWKLLGTGNGRTFTPRDADPHQWAVLTTWDDDAAAAAFERSPTVRAWDRLAAERLRVEMVPVASRGQWSRREPFGTPAPSRAGATGPVASITRARIRLGRGRSFWGAVPPVSSDLHAVPGLRLAVGIGEAPIGLQGTFSLWNNSASLRDFAHRRSAHREVVARTARERWYVEELFARFSVTSLDGTHHGRTP